MIERLFLECGRLGAFTMARTVLLEGRVEPELLRVALAEVQRRTPMLRARFARHRRGNRLEIVASHDAPPPSLVVSRRIDDDHWKTAACDDVHRPFSDDGRLWRATLLYDPASPRCELIIGLHHAICDGAGAHALVAMILRAVVAVEEGTTEAASSDCSSDRPPPAAVDDCLKWPTSRLAAMCRQLAGAFVPSFRRVARLSWERATAPLCERRTSVWFGFLDPARTQRVIDRARRIGCSVNGVVCAALLRACHAIAEHPEHEFILQSNVDLRPACDPPLPREELGTCASGVSTRHRVGDGRSFDELARECATQIKASADSSCWPTYRALGALVSPVLKQAAHGRDQGRSPTIGVSNLGRVALPRTVGRFTVLGMQSLTAQHVIGAHVFLIVGTVHDRLSFSLSSASTVVGDARLAEVGARLIAELGDA